MADLSKLKTRRNSLGDPPPLEAAGTNLLAPEIAPASADATHAKEQQAEHSVVQLRPAVATPAADEDTELLRKRAAKKEAIANAEAKESPRRKRVDGRTLRKTGRNVPLSLHVTAAFDDRLRAIAERDGLLFSVILEKALEAYEAAKAKTK